MKEKWIESGESYSFIRKQLLSDTFFTLYQKTAAWYQKTQAAAGEPYHLFKKEWGNKLKEMEYLVQGQIMS